MTNVEALKELYVALGGDAEDVANVNLISDMIAANAQVIASGGDSVVYDFTINVLSQNEAELFFGRDLTKKIYSDAETVTSDYLKPMVDDYLAGKNVIVRIWYYSSGADSYCEQKYNVSYLKYDSIGKHDVIFEFLGTYNGLYGERFTNFNVGYNYSTGKDIASFTYTT